MTFRLSKKHILSVLTFSIPLVAGQIGQMLFGIGDIMVAGRYSTEVVAALGIATGIMAPFLMVGLGITYAVSAIAARQRGEGNLSSSFFAGSIAASTISGVVLSGLLFIVSKNLHYFNLQGNLSELAQQYIYLCLFSLTPAIVFQAIKEYLQAFGQTIFSNATILIFNIINIGLNYVFIFGKFGFEEMGIRGAAIATVSSRTLMCLILLFYALYKHKYKFSLKINKEEIGDIFKLGLPIGMGTLTEVLVFSAVTILVGRMTILASAAHNIALNLASLTFMIPLALSSAAAVKVGQAYGEGNKDEVVKYSTGSVLLSAIFMSFMALAYFSIPNLLIRFATDEIEVINYAAKLLFFVGLFQIPDGIQVTLWGVLRGMGNTKTPMILSLISNWCIGLPLGCLLAYKFNMEASGLWAGLSLGLTIMAFALSQVYRKMIRNSELL